MKTLFTVIAFVLTFSSFSQERGDNTVIIRTEMDYDEAFRTVGRSFVSKGLTIDDANRDFGTITASGLFVGSFWELTVSAIFDGDENTIITLSGVNHNVDARNPRIPQRVRMRSMGPLSESWGVLLEMANAFEGATIEFEKRDY